MMNTVTIHHTQLPVVEYREQRIVTFSMIDSVHSRAEGTAGRAFRENRERFIDGEDFFNVSVDEIRRNKFYALSPMARGQVTFLTESGYLMLAKTLTDDLAWQVQRQLINGYFRQSPTAITSAAIGRKQLALMVLEAEEKIEELGLQNQQQSATVNSLGKHFTKGLTIPAFCKGMNGVNVNKMMWWASECGWLYNEQRDPEKDPRWRVASYARDKYLTEEQTQVTRTWDGIIYSLLSCFAGEGLPSALSALHERRAAYEKILEW